MISRIRWLSRRARPVPDAGEATAVLHRLAVLLQAGIAPGRAWEHLAATADPGVAEVAAAARRAEPLAPVIAARGGAWGEVAVVWEVATVVGAPLALSLRAAAESLRDALDVCDDVRVALAEPAATARLIAWLPLVAVAMAMLLGFDVLGVLAQPVGAVCAVAGVTLMLIARGWTRRLVRAAQPDPGVPGLACELLAIALSAGVSIERAAAVVTRAGGDADHPDAAEVLALSRSAGAPAVELLRAAAHAARHRARTEGRVRAATLASRLLLPLGVCTLPSFLLLGVAPMLLSVMVGAPGLF